MSEGVEATETEQRFDPEFSDELELLAYPKDERWMDVRIDRVLDSTYPEAVVVFDPPVGEEFRKRMGVSKLPGQKTEFDRLLDATGQNYDTAKEMIDEWVRMRYVGDGWELKNTIDDSDEAATRSYATEIVDTAKWGILIAKTTTKMVTIVAGILLLWPLTGLNIGKSASEEMEMYVGVLVYLSGMVLWYITVEFILSLI